MKNPRHLLPWASLLSSPRQRADIILIDISNPFGKLEKPSVEFFHEVHIDALAKKKLDCKTCHLTKDDQIIPKFKRLTETDRIEVMNFYHDGCITCHGEMKVAGEKAGPTECDECHLEEKKVKTYKEEDIPEKISIKELSKKQKAPYHLIAG